MTDRTKQTLILLLTVALSVLGGAGGGYLCSPSCECCLRGKSLDEVKDMAGELMCCQQAPASCGGDCCKCPKSHVTFDGNLSVKTLDVSESITVKHPKSDKSARIVATEDGVGIWIGKKRFVAIHDISGQLCVALGHTDEQNGHAFAISLGDDNEPYLQLSRPGRPVKIIGGKELDRLFGVVQEEEISADFQADKPLMIFFTADWCGPCRKLKAETLADATVKAFLTENVTELVANENKPLMKKHNVTGFPTLVFFRADRTEAGRIVGYHGKDEFLAKCKKILGK
jgi:thiol-disulfide isomerase/thioredoxin